MLINKALFFLVYFFYHSYAVVDVNILKNKISFRASVHLHAALLSKVEKYSM